MSHEHGRTEPNAPYGVGRARWLWRFVGRFWSFDNTRRCTHSAGNRSPMTHEYAVRSGHPKTRTTSATPIRLHSLTKSMNRAKEKLHNVQERTCDALHTVQCGGMNLTRTQTAALLHFAGKTPRTIGTNHQINGETACIKRGLIAREWVGRTEKRWLTQAGAELVNQVSK